jgi:phosphate starvation-inducible PhoH-like protein
MTIGDYHLSRARGSKAQQRRNNSHNFVNQENTIDFHQATRNKSRSIELRPRSAAQERLVLELLDDTRPVVVALGPAGTGKSYLAMLAAMRDLRAGRCEKLVLTRPAVGVEDERHGFLPGDLIRKMEPWTRPLLDIIKEFYHPREVARMIDDEIIEISPLAFMRGRTFKNAWIVADEMQNATPNQMKMLLTRIGSGSRIVVTGDVEQTDRTTANNGLLDLAARLRQKPTDGLSVCELGYRDIQRHPIIDSVLKIYS